MNDLIPSEANDLSKQVKKLDNKTNEKSQLNPLNNFIRSEPFNIESMATNQSTITRNITQTNENEDTKDDRDEDDIDENESNDYEGEDDERNNGPELIGHQVRQGLDVDVDVEFDRGHQLNLNGALNNSDETSVSGSSLSPLSSPKQASVTSPSQSSQNLTEDRNLSHEKSDQSSLMTENQFDSMLQVNVVPKEEAQRYQLESCRKNTLQQQQRQNNHSHQQYQQHQQSQQNLDESVKQVELFGVHIVALTINGKDRLCLAQISNTLLRGFSYNEIHNRRVALGITCVQCTPIQLEMLRRAGAMPSSSRRCGMITMREAERLCRSFLVEEQPPELPDNFYFNVAHRINYGCRGRFVPARYISSRAKCIECFYCGDFFSPNKFIFHSHRQPHATECNPPDSPNINSWRKHIDLDWTMDHNQETKYAWEDVKSLFNGGTRKRIPTMTSHGNQPSSIQESNNLNISSTTTGGSNNHKSSTMNRKRNQPVNLTDNESFQQEEDQLVDVDGDEDNISTNITALLSMGLIKPPTTESQSRQPVHAAHKRHNETSRNMIASHNKFVGNPCVGSYIETQASVDGVTRNSQNVLSNVMHQTKPGTTSMSCNQTKRITGQVKRSSQADNHQTEPNKRLTIPKSNEQLDVAGNQMRYELGSNQQRTLPITDHIAQVNRNISGRENSVDINKSSRLRHQSSNDLPGLNQVSDQSSSFGFDLATTSKPAGCISPSRLQQQATNLFTNQADGQGPLTLRPYNPSTTLLYNQLYAQLAQQTQGQGSLAINNQQSTAIDVQAALRNQFWTSLIANLQGNCQSDVTNISNQAYNNFNLNDNIDIQNSIQTNEQGGDMHNPHVQGQPNLSHILAAQFYSLPNSFNRNNKLAPPP